MEFVQSDAFLLIDLIFAILITLPFSRHFRTILSIQDQTALQISLGVWTFPFITH